jgi:hypothetical protein
MRPIDFTKATAACALVAYCVYEYPALGQGIIIGLLGLLWLSYLYSTIANRVR